MAASDVSEPKSTATSGRVFPDGLIALTILGAGAFVVVSLSAGVGHPLLTSVLSYLGSCLVAFLPITGVFVAVDLAKGGGEDPGVSPLVIIIMAATLGAGVYYMIHNMVAVPFLVSLSELLGGLVVFGGGWGALVAILERQHANPASGFREFERKAVLQRRLAEVPEPEEKFGVGTEECSQPGCERRALMGMARCAWHVAGGDS